ncbi:Seg1p NDAI_0H02170 [Naumovozyma dairenensis CBS 421]|uniref:Eisosome protein SEG1 n=1 Tax=Naumovozyma dairenensis (strain ATCC 10597 / BCRC 20456 / CBS 421 / NBRC 0211 / NRRL Y-12639) TaxID=1071378 RepID=G0WF30_NAUDC|nr:hypothetical protein NDAI_0H02170 [Naumovozyma dairenensis CBS 421]CCD26391.1 hypothetical protein NDAI_0H02170 [Naumovozyma dairenensis CBS 421]
MFGRSSWQQPPVAKSSANAAAASAFNSIMDRRKNENDVNKGTAPIYKKPSRSASLNNLRRNSILRSPSNSRNNSLTSSPSTKISATQNKEIRNSSLEKRAKSNSIKRSSSVNIRASGSHSSLRASSLPTRKPTSANHQTPRTSLLNDQKSSNDLSAAQNTFREFGGKQTKGIIHSSQNNNDIKNKPPQQTIRKYVPTRNGLVAVNIPVNIVEQQDKQNKQASKVSRARNSMSIRKKVSQENLHSNVTKRHSSLNSVTQLDHSLESEGPLIEEPLVEETEQELSDDKNNNTSNNDNIDDHCMSLDELLNENITLEQKIMMEEKNIEKFRKMGMGKNLSKESQKLLNSNKQTAKPSIRTEIMPGKNTVKNSDKERKDSITNESLQTAISNQFFTTKKTTTVEGQTNNNIRKVPNNKANKNSQEATNQNPISNNKKSATKTIDSMKKTTFASNVKKNGLTKTTINQPTTSKKDTPNKLRNMAYYFRPHKANEEVSTGTHKVHKPKEVSRTDSLYPSGHQHSQNISGKNNMIESVSKRKSNNNLNVPKPPAMKITTPIKSALKKTNITESNSPIFPDTSPANGAYLSLTTAENTRKNALLSSPEDIGRKPSIIARTQVSRPPSYIYRPKNSLSNGISNPSTSTSTSPSSKKANYTGELLPNAIPNSNLKLTKANSSLAVYTANKTSQNDGLQGSPIKTNSRKSVRSNYNPNYHSCKMSNSSTTRKSNEVKKQISQNNLNNILYPKEPPAKKSSFEKLRTVDDSHLGFKIMSLRDEAILSRQEDLQNDIRYQKMEGKDANITSGDQKAWKSRFQDSDSDSEEPYDARGTQNHESPSSRNEKSKRFSLFKIMSNNEENHSSQNPNKNLRSSGVNSSGNVSKKFSMGNLIKTNTNDSNSSPVMGNSTLDQQHNLSPVQQIDARHQNNSTNLTASENDDKKTNVFGKKLKKLFGRKK